jgi:glycosyltransferase involved in cell wall biosynthesis
MTETEQKLLVVILAYNEAERIESVVASAKKHIPRGDIVVINDGSSDQTRQKALRAGANVISHAVNLGYGSSLEAGYMYALENDYHTVLQMDGDGQHMAEEAYKIITPVVNGEADIAIGSRYLENNGYKTSFHRRLGQRFFGFIYRMLTGCRISDPTSGFQCLNRKAMTLNLTGVFPDDFPDVDVLLMAHFAKFRIKEIAVRMLDRSGGTSMHAGFKPVSYVMKMLFSLFIVILNAKELRNHAR